jgi:hypothetical protein
MTAPSPKPAEPARPEPIRCGVCRQLVDARIDVVCVRAGLGCPVIARQPRGMQ